MLLKREHDMKSVMVIGATGLVGREIVKLCLADPTVHSVQTFTRRTTDLAGFDRQGKLKEHIVDFDRVSEWAAKLDGDTLFSAMGTTLRTAGSEEAQYRVDYQYQWDVAHAARQNGCDTHVLISAAGANASSPFFYLRTKGELETDIGMLGYPCLRILQPGLLKGDREETRLGEILADSVLSNVARIVPARFFPLRLRPIPVATVARAALNAARQTHAGTLTFGPTQIWSLAESK